MIFRWKKIRPGTVPALFLHIQKTAGSSIVHLARQFYGASLTSHGDCWGLPPEQFRDVGFVSGHIGYDYARHLMKKRLSFTFLRDPAERILSMYYFCRTRDPAEFAIYRKAHELDLPQFLEAGLTDPFMRMRIWNNQVWQLAHGYTHLDRRTVDDFSEAELLSMAKEHLLEFSHIGFTDTFDTDAAVIMAALGFPKMQQMPKLNTSPDRPDITSLSPLIRSLLDELTVLDRELYDYARTRWPIARKARIGEWYRMEAVSPEDGHLTPYFNCVFSLSEFWRPAPGSRSLPETDAELPDRKYLRGPTAQGDGQWKV